jgi:hypothetical protein
MLLFMSYYLANQVTAAAKWHEKHPTLLPASLIVTKAGFGKYKLAHTHATTALARIKGIDAARQVKFPHPLELGIVFFRVKLIPNVAKFVPPCH